jgi:integrase/recombinase XerD
MATLKRAPRGERRGQPAKTQSLDAVVQDTFRLWRKHHLDYDQTKYVVERVRRRLALEPPRTRNRTVARLEASEIDRLIQTTYRYRSTYGLMLKTLFQTGARVNNLLQSPLDALRLAGFVVVELIGGWNVDTHT